MRNRPDHRLKGLAEPLIGGGLLLVRAAAAFVDNLAMILRIAFITGAVFLVGEIREFTAEMSARYPDAAPAPVAVEAPPPEATPAAGPVLSDRSLHFLNCTYDEYRRENYASCVEEPSEVYPPPEADPDDRGNAVREAPIRFAALTPGAVR